MYLYLPLEYFRCQFGFTTPPTRSWPLQEPMSREPLDYFGAHVPSTKSGPLFRSQSSPLVSQCRIRTWKPSVDPFALFLTRHLLKKKRKKRLCLPANKRILAHLVLPWSAAFINGVKPDAFLASTSMSGHLCSSIFKHSVCPRSNETRRVLSRIRNKLASFATLQELAYFE